MTIGTEQQLRDLFTQQTGHLPDEPDPWQRFVVAERRHRTARRVRRGIAAAALGVVAVGGVLGGAPAWDALRPAHSPASPAEEWPKVLPLPPLWWEPRRGSLVDDQAWLDEMHATAIRSLGAETGFEITGSGDDVRVLFAEDVGSQRLVFVGFRAYPMTGGDEVTMFAWFRGRHGAPAEELTSHTSFDPADAISYVVENRAPGDDRTGSSCDLLLTVIAPRAWTIETSTTADGGQGRSWQRQGADGVAMIGLPPQVEPGEITVRFTTAGGVVATQVPEYYAWTRNRACPRP